MKRIEFFGDKSELNIKTIDKFIEIVQHVVTHKSLSLAINNKKTPFGMAVVDNRLYAFRYTKDRTQIYTTWDEVKYNYTIPGVQTVLADFEFLPEYGLLNITTLDCALATSKSNQLLYLGGEEIPSLTDIIQDKDITPDNLILHHKLNRAISFIKLEASPKRAMKYQGQVFSLSRFKSLQVVFKQSFIAELEQEGLLYILGELGKLIKSDIFFVEDTGLMIASNKEVAERLLPNNKPQVISVLKLLELYAAILIDHKVFSLGKNEPRVSYAYIKTFVDEGEMSPDILKKEFHMYSRLLMGELNTYNRQDNEIIYNHNVLEVIGVQM